MLLIDFETKFCTVDLHPSKALFSLDPDNLQLHFFLGLGTLFCRLFFCPLDQPCKTLQMAQVGVKIGVVYTWVFVVI